MFLLHTKIMKKFLLLFYPILAGSISLVLLKKNSNENVSWEFAEAKRETALGCAPGAADYADNKGKFIGLLPGWGDHSYTISTQSDSAQIYFNQGLSMYYSYHAREALASFREAARFDSTNAFLFWAQALAMGPSYNLGHIYKMGAAVPWVVQNMNRLSPNATAREKDLILAMNQRYDTSDTADRNRKNLNLGYAAAMKELVNKYPEDLEIRALYVDAMMLVHPWDFWYNNGTPKEWTPELVAYCEKILQEDPQHPAGLHYYIHVTEASRKPEVALPAADSLLKLFPGVAHMVHMSSHEYERIGYYAQGVRANELADRSLVVYDSLAKGLFPQVHVPHYYAVNAYCALSGAMQQKASEKTLTVRKSIDPTREMTYFQYLYMFPQLAMVRLGKWQEIIHDESRLEDDWHYASILSDFAKGMAFTRIGNPAKAKEHLASLRKSMKVPLLKKKFVPHTSSPYECAVVAEHILEANIFFTLKNQSEALQSIEKAILAEDSLIYSEPKIWMLPARQYQGAFLMELNRPAEAEKVYREDLVWNPGNGWSLLGLYQALKAQKKTKELEELKKLYMNSFSEAEVIPGKSAY